MQDTLVKADVFDNGEFVCCTLSVWVEQLVDLLNDLAEENQRLIEQIEEYEEQKENDSTISRNDFNNTENDDGDVE